MERRVFEYLQKHPKSSHHQVAKDLAIKEIQALGIIEGLASKGMIKRDVLPLGNNVEPDNSTFYSARGKYSNAFQDISTPFGLVDYLSDSVRRLENSNFIYHYTTLPIVIKMLSNRVWHLGNAKYMNDQLEYKNGDIRKWKNIFFSSFMTEDKESIGMWSMYAQPWEKGIKITIPSKVARKWIDDITEIKEVSIKGYELTGRAVQIFDKEIGLSAVAYCNTDSLTKNEIDNEELRWSNVVNKLLAYASHERELTGYVKDMAWSYEKEIRIRAEFNNTPGFERVAIALPEAVIDAMTFTASPLFEGNLKEELYKEILRQVQVDNSLFQGRLNIKTICQQCELKKLSM